MRCFYQLTLVVAFSTACVARQYNASESSSTQALSLQSGAYQSPVGAGTKIEIGPIAGAGPELKVVGIQQSTPIVLSSKDGVTWNFNGKGCAISVTVNEAQKIYVKQSGPCEYYGFPMSGPDRQFLDLTGPYFAK